MEDVQTTFNELDIDEVLEGGDTDEATDENTGEGE